MEIKYQVAGMTCGGCVKSVTRAIQREIPGVEVDVDLDISVVTVVGEHEVHAVETAVNDAGFQFEGPRD